MRHPPAFPSARLAVVVCSALGMSAALAQGVDTAAAEALARKGNCFKCHAVEREKDGPSFKDVAAHYRGKTDAEAVLARFLKTGVKVGKDAGSDLHKQVGGGDAEIGNLVRYVLSR